MTDRQAQLDAIERHLAATTGHARCDVTAAIAALRQNNPGAGTRPWSDADIAAALPTIAEVATLSRTTMENTARALRQWRVLPL